MTTKNTGIQWMRALAALLVVVDHGLFTLVEKAGADPAVAAHAALIGGSGVQLFFIISGFVMLASSSDSFGRGASLEFMRRRLVRIAPLYWLATIVYAVKQWQVTGPVSFVNLTKSVFFVPYLNSNGEIQPIYGLGWTLNYEVFFYAVFAVGLLHSRRVLLLLTGAVIGMLVVVGGFIGDSASKGIGLPFYFYSRPIALFFLAGMALAWAIRPSRAGASGFSLPVWGAASASIALTVASVALRWSGTDSLVAQLTLLTAALWFAASSVRDARAAWIMRSAVLLGDASYSIYLTHSFVVGPLGRIYGKLGYTAVLPFLLTCLVVCSALGVLCYRYLEKPLMRRLSRRTSTDRSRREIDAATAARIEKDALKAP